MQTPEDLKYTPEHEWIRDEGDGKFRVGITDFAQDELGDIVYVELPEVGAEYEKGALFAEVESTKSVGEVFAPMAGSISEVNEVLIEAPETINADPYGNGWLAVFQVTGEADLSETLDAAGYAALTE